MRPLRSSAKENDQRSKAELPHMDEIFFAEPGMRIHLNDCMAQHGFCPTARVGSHGIISHASSHVNKAREILVHFAARDPIACESLITNGML